ncbi:MAG: T9SS type A sorting domain-containing protein, partial [Chitinophagaceae bacterium]
VYYRIRVTGSGTDLYSKIILLSNRSLEFAIKSLINPVSSGISFDLISPTGETADIIITDTYGRVIRQSKHSVSEGLNHMLVNTAGMNTGGTYIMKIRCGSYSVSKRLIKVAQ